MFSGLSSVGRHSLYDDCVNEVSTPAAENMAGCKGQRPL